MRRSNFKVMGEIGEERGKEKERDPQFTDSFLYSFFFVRAQSLAHSNGGSVLQCIPYLKQVI